MVAGRMQNIFVWPIMNNGGEKKSNMKMYIDWNITSILRFTNVHRLINMIYSSNTRMYWVCLHGPFSLQSLSNVYCRFQPLPNFLRACLFGEQRYNCGIRGEKTAFLCFRQNILICVCFAYEHSPLLTVCGRSLLLVCQCNICAFIVG